MPAAYQYPPYLYYPAVLSHSLQYTPFAPHLSKRGEKKPPRNEAALRYGSFYLG
jgi:hypothetical protein